MTISEAIAWAKEYLIEPAESRYLLCAAISKSAAFLLTYPEHILNSEERELFERSVIRRSQGEPVAYILGHKPFWTLELECSPCTLIPRSETELLVETVLDYFPTSSLVNVCELGTGTGAIALSIASERPDWNITAVDKIEESVELSKRNLEKYGFNNVALLISDWFSALGNSQFDVIISNPPYVEDNSPFLQQGDVRYEPRTALTSGIDGLDDIKHIVSRASKHLKDKGYLLIEHGFQQSEAIKQLLKDAGFIDIELRLDFNQLPRVTIARKPEI